MKNAPQATAASVGVGGPNAFSTVVAPEVHFSGLGARGRLRTPRPSTVLGTTLSDVEGSRLPQASDRAAGRDAARFPGRTPPERSDERSEPKRADAARRVQRGDIIVPRKGAIMKRREFIVSSVLGSVGIGAARIPLGAAADDAAAAQAKPVAATRKILIAGGGFGTAFIRYMAQLTGKPRPKMCYLPTASADSPSGNISWFRNCAPLNVEPFVQESFIASPRQTQGWDEVFLSMDGIVVLRRQHAESAGDLEGAGHRCGAQTGVGSRHRARRRQRRIAVLVRGGHNGLAAEGADHGPVPRLPERQPLAALRSRRRSGGRCTRS